MGLGYRGRSFHLKTITKILITRALSQEKYTAGYVSYLFISLMMDMAPLALVIDVT